MHQLRVLACAVFAAAAGTGVAGQWLKLPTPGIPRLPDGKPNLTAPAPRTADGKPDFSGLWQNDGGDRLYNNITVDLQPGDVAPWADAIYQKRRLEFGKDSMETLCLPMGPAYLTTRYRMNRIVQTPTLVAFAVRRRDAPRDLDGRPQPGGGSQSDVDGVFRGPMGRRHAGGREQRLHRSLVARLRRPSPHRAAAHHRALLAPRLRSHRRPGDDGRSQGLPEADHVHDADGVAGRHRDARSGVREPRQEPRTHRDHQGGAGRHGAGRRRCRATSASTTSWATPSTS